MNFLPIKLLGISLRSSVNLPAKHHLSTVKITDWDHAVVINMCFHLGNTPQHFSMKSIMFSVYIQLVIPGRSRKTLALHLHKTKEKFQDFYSTLHPCNTSAVLQDRQCFILSAISKELRLNSIIYLPDTFTVEPHQLENLLEKYHYKPRETKSWNDAQHLCANMNAALPLIYHRDKFLEFVGLLLFHHDLPRLPAVFIGLLSNIKVRQYTHKTAEYL